MPGMYGKGDYDLAASRAKIARIAHDLPEIEIQGDPDAALSIENGAVDDDAVDDGCGERAGEA